MDEEQTLARSFEADGVVYLPGTFGSDWVDLARRGIEANLAHPSPFFRDLSMARCGYVSDMWSRRFIPEFERFCRESPAAAIAARALRVSRIRLAQDLWFLKRPGAADATPWHQDTAVSGPFCTIWVALDPTPRAEALEFVRGSHAWDKLMLSKVYFEALAGGCGASGIASGDGCRLPDQHFYVDYRTVRRDGGGGNDHGPAFGEVPDIEANRALYDIVGWDMEPGDCLVFDARTLHGAAANHSDQPIRRFITRWVTDDAVVSHHGQNVVDAIIKAGLNADIGAGRPLRGPLFPEFTPSPTW